MLGLAGRPKLIPAKVRDVVRFARSCRRNQINMFVEISQVTTAVDCKACQGEMGLDLQFS